MSVTGPSRQQSEDSSSPSRVQINGRRGGKAAEVERLVAEAQAAGEHVHAYGNGEPRCINGTCDLTENEQTVVPESAGTDPVAE